MNQSPATVAPAVLDAADHRRRPDPRDLHRVLRLHEQETTSYTSCHIWILAMSTTLAPGKVIVSAAIDEDGAGGTCPTRPDCSLFGEIRRGLRRYLELDRRAPVDERR